MTAAEVASKSYLALVHHPVYDKHRRVVATSVTNLDIHDIARSSKTYGLGAYFIVHPVAAQRELVRRIIGHWQDGPGQEQNDFRSAALALVRVVATLEEAVAAITAEHGQAPLLVATSASPNRATVGPKSFLRDPDLNGRPVLLLFGTGWGLTEEVLEKTDRMLQAIRGTTDYNHLSVRSAAGIMLDRLFGVPEEDAGEQRP